MAAADPFIGPAALFLRQLQTCQALCEGIALAMAMQTPYIERDRKMAIAGGLGYYEGKASFSASAALRMTSDWQLSGGLAVGFNHGTVGARIGSQFSW